MKVWFHSLYNQEPDEEGAYNYDTFTDSKLFASLTACSHDARRIYEEEFKAAEQRYSDAVRRYRTAWQALAALDEAEIDVSDLYWINYTKNPPEFHEPQERYIYSLDVE